MGAPYPGFNTVWNLSLNHNNLQPTVQVPSNQPGEPTGQFSYTQIEQHVEPTLQITRQVSVPSSQQVGPSMPRTHVQSVVQTSVQQPSTPIPRVSQVPVATTS